MNPHLYPLVAALVDDGQPVAHQVSDVIHLTLDREVCVMLHDRYAHAYLANLGRIVPLVNVLEQDLAAIRAAVADLRGQQ